MILAAQVNEALQDFDAQLLKTLMAEDPAKFFSLAATVTSQTNERTKREALELQVRKYEDTIQKAQKELQKLRDPKKELSESDRKSIVDKVDEILGLK